MKNIKKIITMMLFVVSITQLNAQSEDASESNRLASDEAQMKATIKSKLAAQRHEKREEKFGADSERFNRAPSEEQQSKMDARVEKILQRKMEHLAKIDARIEKLTQRKTKIIQKKADSMISQNKGAESVSDDSDTALTERLAKIDTLVDKLTQKRVSVMSMENFHNKNDENLNDDTVTIQSEEASQPTEATNDVQQASKDNKAKMRAKIREKIESRRQTKREAKFGDDSEKLNRAPSEEGQAKMDARIEKIFQREMAKRQSKSAGSDVAIQSEEASQPSMKEMIEAKMKARRGNSGQQGSGQRASMRSEFMEKMKARRGSNSQTASAQ